MKSSVETLNPTRVRFTVEVPFEELRPSLDSAYKKIAAQVSIPGFRKGRVPASIIDQRVGRGTVLEEAVNEHLPQAYNAAVEEHKVKPLGQPEVDVTQFDDGKDLTFTAEVDVRPEITLPEYEGIAVEVADADVTDDDVAEQLKSLAARFGSLSTVERAVETGDFVTLDLSATADGEPVEDATANGMSYEVGSGQLLDGIDDAIVGKSAGESATFTAPLMGSADSPAEITALVTAVKVRTLPPLDDDFAQLASEFDTLDELTVDLKTRLGSYKKLQQGVEARDKVLEKLLTMVEIPLPESVIAGQIASHFEDGHGADDDAHRAEFEKQTREGMTAQFLLDDIATKEELSVGEGELSEYIIRNAPRYGMSPDQFAQEIVQAGQVPAVVGEVVRAKALATVLESANVTDASGRVVDLNELTDEEA